MIIPVRCFTCNNIIGSKYRQYCEIVEKIKNNEIDKQNDNLTPEAEAFNLLRLKRYCCKRHLLGHVDIVDKI